MRHVNCCRKLTNQTKRLLICSIESLPVAFDADRHGHGEEESQRPEFTQDFEWSVPFE